MKKNIFLASILVATSTFAFDLGAVKSIGSAMGVTPESLGEQLATMAKEKAPQTAQQAKSLCEQASTYKSFVGIADDGIMAKAINICADKVSENLTDKAKDTVTNEALKALPSITNSLK